MTIIQKDVGIVNDEARMIGFPATLSAVSEQLFSAGIGAGLGRDDDGNIVKLWERFGGKAVVESGSIEEEEAKAAKAESGEDAIQIVGDLLYAVHLISAAEALAFARRKNMNLADVFNVVGTSAATSKPLVEFKDELSNPAKEPKSGQKTVNEVLESLNGVIAAAKKSNTPLFLTQAALVRLTEAKAQGWGDKGASIVGRLWK